MRAVDLAQPLPPALGGGIRVDRALERLVRAAAREAVVTEGGRIVGVVNRDTLESAVQHGADGLRVRDLLLSETSRVPPGASAERVRAELERAGRGFVLVGRSAARIRGWIRGEPAARHSERGASLALPAVLGPSARSALARVARAARACGGRAYLVGGVVRDLMLGRDVRDLDVVIEGDVAEVARRLDPGARIHAAFMTATLEPEPGVRVDLARARTERYAAPAALPQTAPARLAEDLARRDFTVNAMALPLRARGIGRLIDPLRGRDDLRRRTLRVLHPLSFIEDPTRGLRAVRFAVRLGFEIEPRTRRLIGVALGAGAFGRLSAARLRREAEALLGGPRPDEALRLLTGLRLWPVLAPGVPVRVAERARIRRLDVALRTLESAAVTRPVERWSLALAALVVGTGSAAAEDVIARLQPRRAERALLRDAAGAVPGLLRRLERRKALRPSDIHAAGRDHTRGALVVAMVATRRPALRSSIAGYLRELARTAADVGAPELLEAGIAPGPAIARGLDAALRAKLDRPSVSRREQLRVALRAARRA